MPDHPRSAARARALTSQARATARALMLHYQVKQQFVR
jgi:hypothetical protein